MAAYARRFLPRPRMIRARLSGWARLSGRVSVPVLERLIASEAAYQETLDELGVERPRTRGDCEGGERPCPWVSCRYHLALDVSPVTGSVKRNLPHLDVEDMPQTCALDIADEGTHDLATLGRMLNLTRERVRQIETMALDKVRRRTGRDDGR